MALRIITILLLAPFLMGQQFTGTVFTGGSMGVDVGGPVVTLDDDFESDIDDWAGRGSAACTPTGGDLHQDSNTGMCWYDDSTPDAAPGGGTQPLTRDQWAIFEFGAAAEQFHGPSLRTKTGSSVPTGSEYNYVARCSATNLQIRVCSADISCQTLAVINSNCATPGTNDLIALAVAGETTSTEICAWWWDSGDTLPSNNKDPTTWGNADLCVSEDGSIDNAKFSGIAGTPTQNDDWDTNSNQCTGAPTACRGYPAAGQLDIGAYAGAADANDWESVVGGDL